MNKKTTKPRGDENDDDEFTQGFPVSFIPHRTGTYYCDIIGPIRSAAQFTDIISILNQIDENSTVVFNLQTGGGSLSAADVLIHAIRKTEGHVHFVASVASSAGSLLLLEADSFELTENFHSLIHNGSLGSGGNYNEFVSAADFNKRTMKRVLTKSYEGFLTPAEIEDLLKGVDIWLDADDWVARAKARNEHMQAKYLLVEEQKIIEEPEPVLKKPAKKTSKKKTDAQ